MPKGKPKKAKMWSSLYENVTLPIESFGACSNAKNCKNWEVELGDGWCTRCWDRKASRYLTANQGAK